MHFDRVAVRASGFLDFPIAELCTFDAGGGTNAFNRGDPPQCGELFRRKRLHHLPSPLELIDLGNELQDFGRGGDVPDRVRTDIHLYPFSPDCYQRAIESIYTRLHPVRLTGSKDWG